MPDSDGKQRTLLQDSLYIFTMVLILVFAAKWYITIALLIILGWMLKAWFTRDECKSWVDSTWGFMKQIFPLLGGGVLVAGFMLGRPGHPALIPEKADVLQWIK
ncbi:MAG: hypothetical protein V2L15_00985 [Desulfobacteraceae bacterium]|nr:hypothetical protein [Desulfobacteraceae bacterium]